MAEGDARRAALQPQKRGDFDSPKWTRSIPSFLFRKTAGGATITKKQNLEDLVSPFLFSFLTRLKFVLEVKSKSSDSSDHC